MRLFLGPMLLIALVAYYMYPLSAAAQMPIPVPSTETVSRVRQAAEVGDADAQRSLGQIYFSGRGLKQDSAEAAKWYRMAADQGIASAQHELGQMYERGDGIKRPDRIAALALFLIAKNNIDGDYTAPDRDIKDLQASMSREQIRLAKTIAAGGLGAVWRRIDQSFRAQGSTRLSTDDASPSRADSQGIRGEREQLTELQRRTPSVAISQVAQPRVALVIGNASYLNHPLKNPLNDARDLAQVLRSVGFEVHLRTNLSADEMKSSIAAFGDQLSRDRAVGLFYYSGHGVQTGRGMNYLLPVGREFKQERDVELFGVEARAVLARMEEAGNPLNIIIFDACRDSPLPATARNVTGKGLARMTAPAGAVIAFATAPGTVASDNPTERNGLYTKHLIATLRLPGLRLEDVFKRVGAAVERESNGAQSPEEIYKLRNADDPFYFVKGAVNN